MLVASEFILVSIYSINRAPCYQNTPSQYEILWTYPIVFRISFSFGTRPRLCPGWIAGASNNILVPHGCDDSNEISLLPMFLLTSVMNNSITTDEFWSANLLAIYKYFWSVPLVWNSPMTIEKPLRDVFGLSWHPQTAKLLETPWIRSVKSPARNSLCYRAPGGQPTYDLHYHQRLIRC